MFTGIITDVGTLVQSWANGDLHLKIGTSYDSSSIDIGASIACDGVCLTVVDRGREAEGDWFVVALSQETESKTTLKAGMEPGRKINLERALRVGDELGGHIVSGHVDGVAKVVSMAEERDSVRAVIDAPESLACFIAPKGSIALNGTSLTVNEVDGARFGVNLIPHTKRATSWGEARPGDSVNIEIDTLARYVARLKETLA